MSQQEYLDPSVNLEQVRLECLALVKNRAYISAGIAIIPVPFLDLVIDVSILSQLIPEINARFGLSASRVSVYNPQTKTVNWDELKKRGVEISSMVASRTAAKASFQGFFAKILTKQVSKFIPLGGQLVSASLGYLLMKKIAEAHIDDCYIAAKKLQQEYWAKQQNPNT